VVISRYGATIGVILGAALTRALSGQGIEVLSVPVGRLALLLVLAGVIRVLAALWPARMRVLTAIATA
jgi:putative ABC transport system permease protein